MQIFICIVVGIPVSWMLYDAIFSYILGTWYVSPYSSREVQVVQAANFRGDANTFADPFPDPCDRSASVHCLGHGARRLQTAFARNISCWIYELWSVLYIMYTHHIEFGRTCLVALMQLNTNIIRGLVKCAQLP